MKGAGFARMTARLMLGTNLAFMATTAFAAEAADAAQGSADGVKLEEIVVTAQKREQNLQVVPVAISAISAERVSQLAIKDAKDLSGMAPNVTIVQGTTNSNAAVISIRGIPTSAQETFGLDTANALYVDGVYIARSGGSAIDVTDIERVEVLRGPQGTLFGRNTTGGGIAFISRAPSKTFLLKAEAGYGNYSALNGKITIDPGQIGGFLTSSLTYSHRERHGTVDNLNEANDALDPGARKSDGIRAAVKAEFGDSGSIQYIFDWNRTNASPINFQLTNTADGTPRAPFVVDGVQVAATQQAPVSQYLAGATFLDPACAALATPTRAWRKTVCNDINSRSLDETWGHNLQIQNDFGPVKVKSTTGWRIWHNDSVTDLDGIGAFNGPAFGRTTLFNGFPSALLQGLGFPATTSGFLAGLPVPKVQQNLFDSNNKRRHQQFSQEVEFSGQTSNLDWVLGGFYFWEQGSEYNPQNSGFVLDTNSAVFSDAAFVGVLQGVGFPAATAAQFAPVLAPNFRATNPARYRLVQTLSVLNYGVSAESTAVYGQATFYPGGRDSGIRLTAGGRYTWDTKEMTRYQNGVAPLVTADTGSAKYHKFTWNIMVGYDVTQGVNMYGRIATGYRSGGFNAQDPSVGGVLPSFRPESLTSYELGLKSELFDRRVRFNLAGYYNEYKDLAIAAPVANAAPGTFATQIVNAGKVTYTGVEAELAAALTENFNIEANTGYVKVKFKEFLSGQPVNTALPAVNIASFAKAGYTSPFTASVALNAQFPIGDKGMRVVGRVSYSYEDGKYSLSNVIASPFIEAIKGDAHSMVDAQLGLDRIPLASGQGFIRLWVKNLTNRHELVRGIDFGSLGYAGGYFADPRTYGVTAGVKF